MTNVLAVIQARMSSSRLPGKVMMPILGVAMITRQIERIKYSKRIDDIVVATSTHHSDDILVAEMAQNSVNYFRGDLNDVLSRFYEASVSYTPKHIVRITGDCPLIDPDLIDIVINKHLDSNADYTSNVFPPTFPDGLDVEVIRFNVLKAINEMTLLPSEREHVTLHIRKNPHEFEIHNVISEVDYSGKRWTVDNIEDFVLIKRIFEALYFINNKFTTSDIFEFIRNNSEIESINSIYKRKNIHCD